MKYNPISKTLAIPVILLGATTGLTHAALVNGDFEAAPFDSSWDNDFTSTTGIAPGSTTAVDAGGTGSSGDIFQLTASGLDTGTIGFWVRPDSLVTGQRTFNLVVGTTVGTSAINIRLNPNAGGTAFSLQRFSGGWADVSGSTDDFAVGSTYYFELGVNDLGTAGASYDLAWSGANPGSATTSESATGITSFQSGTHATNAGATIDRLRFVRSGAHGTYTLDDVSLVPEPSVALLGGLGLLGLLRRRRA